MKTHVTQFTYSPVGLFPENQTSSGFAAGVKNTCKGFFFFFSSDKPFHPGLLRMGILG